MGGVDVPATLSQGLLCQSSMTRKVGFPPDLLLDVPFHLLTLKEGAVTRQPGCASLGMKRWGGKTHFPFSPEGKGIS